MLITNSFFIDLSQFYTQERIQIHSRTTKVFTLYIYECKISIIKGNAIAKFQSKKSINLRIYHVRYAARQPFRPRDIDSHSSRENEFTGRVADLSKSHSKEEGSSHRIRSNKCLMSFLCHLGRLSSSITPPLLFLFPLHPTSDLSISLPLIIPYLYLGPFGSQRRYLACSD